MKFSHFLFASMACALVACTNDDPLNEPTEERPVVTDGEGETPDYDPDDIPTFDYQIPAYGGETAADAVSYQPGNKDLNPDANEWTNEVRVVYNGNGATVTAPQTVNYTVLGANVELRLGQTKNVKVTVSGSSDSGSLALTGSSKHLLELDNLTLTSTDRPAIFDQIAKRVFIVLKGHNRLADGANYEYKTSKRKGCFYAADHAILCGDGVLEIKGNNRHGFVTDGFLFVNPGATLAVTDAKKNAVSVDGAGVNNNYRGIEMVGGYIYAHTSAPAGKAVKCDSHIALRGGRLALYASGNAAIDPEDGLLSSPACLKSDSTVNISGGEIVIAANGLGAKGVSADFDININGGILKIANSGSSTANGNDNSTAKALNAHGNITIGAGGIYLSATGEGSSAISSDADVNMTQGVVYAFGANYGIKSLRADVSGGTFLCGGAQNVDVDGVAKYDYTDIAADKVSVIIDENNTTIAAFRWPVKLDAASLLHRGE